MCDYSLMEISNRLARPGEELVVHRFPTGTKGLMSPHDRPILVPQASTFWKRVKEFFSLPSTDCAVCVPPGAQLLLREIPDRLQHELKIGSIELVTFTQVSAQVGMHLDAVMFSNGRPLLLQSLQEGQFIQVISLSSRDAVDSLHDLYGGAGSLVATTEI